MLLPKFGRQDSYTDRQRFPAESKYSEVYEMTDRFSRFSGDENPAKFGPHQDVRPAY